MAGDEDVQIGKTTIALVSLLLLLVGDRVYIAVELENARTRVAALEEHGKALESWVRMIRERQVENESRITVLEQRVKR